MSSCKAEQGAPRAFGSCCRSVWVVGMRPGGLMEVVSGPLRLSEGTGSQARLACGRAARPGAGARLGLPGTTGRRGLSGSVPGGMARKADGVHPEAWLVSAVSKNSVLRGHLSCPPEKATENCSVPSQRASCCFQHAVTVCNWTPEPHRELFWRERPLQRDPSRRVTTSVKDSGS